MAEPSIEAEGLHDLTAYVFHELAAADKVLTQTEEHATAVSDKLTELAASRPQRTFRGTHHRRG